MYSHFGNNSNTSNTTNPYSSQFKDYPISSFKIEFNVEENEFRVIETIERYVDTGTPNIIRVENKLNQKIAYAGSIANCYAYVQARKEGLIKQ